ncbi:MAG: hypothetical protein ABSE25_01665 [Syntrophorhabdales bacterium]
MKGVIPVMAALFFPAARVRQADSRESAAWVLEEMRHIEFSAINYDDEVTGAHVLYVKNRTREDPNNDMGTKYKEALKEAVEKNRIGFILDLHGSGGSRPFKIDIGIMDNSPARCSCPTFRDILEKVFADFEPRIFNQRFPARSGGTITCFARNSLGIEAAQVEINANYRIVRSKSTGFETDPANIVDLTKRLRRVIEAADNRIGRTTTR